MNFRQISCRDGGCRGESKHRLRKLRASLTTNLIKFYGVAQCLWRLHGGNKFIKMLQPVTVLPSGRLSRKNKRHSLNNFLIKTGCHSTALIDSQLFCDQWVSGKMRKRGLTINLEVIAAAESWRLISSWEEPRKELRRSRYFPIYHREQLSFMASASIISGKYGKK